MDKTPFTEVYMFPDYKILIDLEDISKIVNRSWHKFNNNNRGVYLRGWDKELKKKVFLHRVILDVFDPSIQVDHINRNIHDNRKSNLRLCSHRENILNRGIQGNNTSGYKGVHKIKNEENVWMAHIGVNGAKLYLGRYNTPEEAAKVYNKAAIKYFGDFAKVNEL